MYVNIKVSFMVIKTKTSLGLGARVFSESINVSYRCCCCCCFFLPSLMKSNKTMGEGAHVEDGMSLIKQLASCNQRARNKALRVLLNTWLPSQPALPEDDLKKLWKGLFYCVWHADKFPVQSHLIDRLSSLLLRLHLPLSLRYFSVFLLTMRREWPGIDALRLDKFYLLIRRFLHHCFAFLKSNSWDLEISSRLMGVLVESTFFADDKFQGNGVNYHIASVFLEELRPFLPVRSEILELLLEPFVSVMGRLPDKVLLGKIRSNMFGELLKMGKKLLEIKKVGVRLIRVTMPWFLGQLR
jgi:ribosomal RNA-processing protein 1